MRKIQLSNWTNYDIIGYNPGMGSLLIAILGLPGAGKSTQAQSLARELNTRAVSGGSILRLRAQMGDKEAASIIRQGLPMSVTDYARMLESTFTGAPARHLVLDGSPRSSAQVLTLAQALARLETVFHTVGIVLACSDITTIRERLKRRRHEMARAFEDDDEMIDRRILLQKDHLTSTVESFSEHWPVYAIDATQPSSQVAKTIRDIVTSQG